MFTRLCRPHHPGLQIYERRHLRTPPPRTFAPDKGAAPGRGTAPPPASARSDALYHYFPSKQSLYAAIVDEKIGAPALPDIASKFAARRNNEAVFTTLAKGLLERGLGDPDFVRLVQFTALEGHELASPIYAARIGALREFVTRYIETRMQQGAFRACDADFAGRCLIGMVSDYVQGRVIRAPAEVASESIDEVATHFVEFFLIGVRARVGVSPEGRS